MFFPSVRMRRTPVRFNQPNRTMVIEITAEFDSMRHDEYLTPRLRDRREYGRGDVLASKNFGLKRFH